MGDLCKLGSNLHANPWPALGQPEAKQRVKREVVSCLLAVVRQRLQPYENARHSPGVCSSKASNPATHFFSSTFTGAAPAGGAALLGDAPSFDLFTTVEKYFFTTSWYSRGTWLFAIASVACC